MYVVFDLSSRNGTPAVYFAGEKRNCFIMVWHMSNEVSATSDSDSRSRNFEVTPVDAKLDAHIPTLTGLAKYQERIDNMSSDKWMYCTRSATGMNYEHDRFYFVVCTSEPVLLKDTGNVSVTTAQYLSNTVLGRMWKVHVVFRHSLDIRYQPQ